MKRIPTKKQRLSQEHLPKTAYKLPKSEITNHRILIDVTPGDTVGDVKAKIEDFGDGLPILPPNMQRLYYLGRQLDDGSTLRHSNIHHGDTLELRWREGDATDYLFNAE